MCLIVIDWRPQQHLLVSANRDEFHARPSAAMHYWDEHPHILAGRDLQQGGSWLALSTQGRFAALTNIRAPHLETQHKRSRGDWVIRAMNTPSWSAFIAQLQHEYADYGPFNLLFGDQQQLFYCHNTPAFHYQALDAGYYTLSNAHLNSHWPKSFLAAQQLHRWQQYTDTHTDTHTDRQATPVAILNRTHAFSDTQLPSTGVPILWERMLSAQHILNPQYGTRCSTGIALYPNYTDVDEYEYAANGEKTRQFSHRIAHVNKPSIKSK